jgi:hypothetical protein
MIERRRPLHDGREGVPWAGIAIVALAIVSGVMAYATEQATPAHTADTATQHSPRH